MVFLVDDVEVVDRLELFGLAPHLAQGLADGQALAEAGELGGHHRAGGVLGIGAEALDVAALVGRDQRHQLLDDLRLDVAQQVDAVVGRQLADKLGHLGAADGLHDLDLLLFREEAEDLHAQRHLGMLKDRPRLLGRQALHELGGPRGVKRRAEFVQFGRVVFGQRLAELGEVERVGHGDFLL